MSERMKFEKWVKVHHGSAPLTRKPHSPEEYDGVLASWTWQAWQAAKATTPAWHDFPTAKGLWVCDAKDGTVPFVLAELEAPNAAKWMQSGSRWFGPIPIEEST